MSRLLNLNEVAAWNATNPNGENYQPSIQGTVVEIREVQARDFKTKQPDFWPDGNPKLNICMVIQDASGTEYPWTFSPKSLAFDAVKAALNKYNPQATSIADVGGLMVHVWTEGDSSQYHANKPRPWGFEIIGQGTAPFKGVVEFKPQQAMPQQATQQPAQQTPPPMVNGYYAPPQVPPSPVNRPMQPQAPQQYQAPQFQPVPQAPQQAPQVVYPPADQVPMDIYGDMPF